MKIIKNKELVMIANYGDYEKLLVFALANISTELTDKYFSYSDADTIQELRELQYKVSLNSMKKIFHHSGDFRNREFYNTLPEVLKGLYEDGLTKLYSEESMKDILGIK